MCELDLNFVRESIRGRMGQEGQKNNKTLEGKLPVLEALSKNIADTDTEHKIFLIL